MSELITPINFYVCATRAAEGEVLAAQFKPADHAQHSARLNNAVHYSGDLKHFLKHQPATGSALILSADGLGLYALDMPGSGAVRVDLSEGALGFRVAQERARHEMIVKACGLKKYPQPVRVFDATAGLLRDASVLAAAGAQVRVAERSPLIAALIHDGLQRAQRVSELQFLLMNLNFCAGDALHILQAMAEKNKTEPNAEYKTDDERDWQPDVICLDPMFPHRDKSALVKKDMRVFRDVVGADNDADALLAPALAAAKKRVVVKRPRLAPCLADKNPSMVLEGKTGRFDIYLVG